MVWSMPSLCSIWEASESNYLTWIHTFIHVPPPIPTLTYELFEGEFLWSASASVQWRPSQLALTSNELCRAVRAGRHRFDKAQVKVPAAGVGVSWPPLGGILTGGASNRKTLASLNTAAAQTDKKVYTDHQFLLKILVWVWFSIDSSIFSIYCQQKAQRGNEMNKWGQSCAVCQLNQLVD